MDSDQTARMRRLVWIHAVQTHYVGFVMARLIYKFIIRTLSNLLTPFCSSRSQWEIDDRASDFDITVLLKMYIR
jgi:hypothetical protein